MIHEIRVKNVNTKKQKETIEKLLKHNEMFHKNLNITRAAGSKSVKRLSKVISSLIVETGSSKIVNRIIEGFLKRGSRKDAMVFVREWLKKLTRWVMKLRLLSQFTLAHEHLHQVSDC